MSKDFQYILCNLTNLSLSQKPLTELKTNFKYKTDHLILFMISISINKHTRFINAIYYSIYHDPSPSL